MCFLLPFFQPESINNFLSHSFSGLKLLLHERQGSHPLRELLSNTADTSDSTIFVVGPEGGWTEFETQAFEDAGFTKVHLGSRIMRVETAGLALAAIIQYERGDF